MEDVFKYSVLKLAGAIKNGNDCRGGVGANIVNGGMSSPWGGTCWGGAGGKVSSASKYTSANPFSSMGAHG